MCIPIATTKLLGLPNNPIVLLFLIHYAIPVCSNCINHAPNLPEGAKLYVQNNYFTLASSVLSKNTKDPPDPSANNTVNTYQQTTWTMCCLFPQLYHWAWCLSTLQEVEYCCTYVTRGLNECTVKMYGDAIKEFLVFPRALYSSQGDQYIL